MATVSQFCINGIDYDVKDKRLKTEREKQNIIIDPFKEEEESTYGNKSVSIGYDNVAEGEGSVALGIGTKATGNYQTVIGKYNSDDNQSAFIIGNGTDDDNRSQLFNIYQNGRVITRGPGDQTTGAGFVTVLNNMNESSVADVSTNHWGEGFSITDNTGTVRSYFRHNDITDGQGLQLETRRYINGSAIYNGVRVAVDQNGTPKVNFNYPAAWREGLGLDTASNIITNTGGADTWRTALGIGAIQSSDNVGWTTLSHGTWKALASITLSKGTYLILSSASFGYLESGEGDQLLAAAMLEIDNAANQVASNVSKMPTFAQKTRVLTKRAGGGVAAIQIQRNGETANQLLRSAASAFQIGWSYNKAQNYHLQTLRFLPLSGTETIYVRGYQNYASPSVTAAAYLQALRIA